MSTTCHSGKKHSLLRTPRNGFTLYMLLSPHRKGLPYAKELEPGVEEAAGQVNDCQQKINKIRTIRSETLDDMKDHT